MAVSNGSSPACRRPNFKRRRFVLAGVAVAAVFHSLVAAAPLPDYARAALEHFSTRTPAGWAYTLTTSRDDQEMVERFDPTQAPERQWTLQKLDGRAPTASELENYRRSRPDAATGGPQPVFQKEDIEPGSFALVREDTHEAEFRGAFRSASATRDQTLSHLALVLSIRKQEPYVARYRLELREPYSPVLAVKIKSLTVEATFAAPEGTRPSLPLALTSDFSGTMLLFPKTERLRVVYSDFVAVPNPLSR